MEELINTYSDRVVTAGLCAAPLVCGLDDRLIWNRRDRASGVLEEVMKGMNINSLICGEPSEPYATILKYLVEINPQRIVPRDCETRTFLHDLPVSREFSVKGILSALKRRKLVITEEGGVIRLVSFGTVTPEQAFVTFSSVCFAAFVLFFSDYLSVRKKGTATKEQNEAFERVVALLRPLRNELPRLMKGPFEDRVQVCRAMEEAGRATVDYGLVDSYFGNISYRVGRTVNISQTGASLDSLGGCIDPCSLDNSSCAGITASSELTAHSEIYLSTENRAILHGHPPFSVILSMDCDDERCIDHSRCHLSCPYQRFIEDVPIVPGEVGTGPTGLCHTLPPAITGRRGCIVWGHGLFTVGKKDFNEAFRNLHDIESMCRRLYFERLVC